MTEYRIKETVQTFHENIVEKYTIEKLGSYDIETHWREFCKRHNSSETHTPLHIHDITSAASKSASGLPANIERLCYNKMEELLKEEAWVPVRDFFTLEDAKKYLNLLEKANKANKENKRGMVDLESNVIRKTNIVYP